MVFFEAGVLEI